MKDGKYYSCINDFLEKTKNNNSKKFIFVAEYTIFDNESFENYPNEIIGAIVPFVIYDTEFFNKGVISYDLDENDEFTIVENMQDYIPSKEFFDKTKSLIVVLDGLSSQITNFLEKLFEASSLDTQIVGGGAGKMTFEREPVIFCKNKFYKDASIIISLSNHLSIAIENGWEVLKGPFLATNSEKNILKNLNFRPAFEVYKEIVEKDSKHKFGDDNFFDIAKSYPLGIIKYDKEIVVRDPIMVDEEGNMILVGDIPLNSSVNILIGKPDNLIKSSANAIKKSCAKKFNKEPKSLILFDCISRSIFLGDKFNDELELMKLNLESSIKLCGALTLGEIANNGNEYISFYNKSCVVGVVC